MNKRKICVVTGTRSEYGIFYPILKKIQSSTKLKLQLIATTAHLSSEFGLTYKQIEKDGFSINEKIDNLLSSDTKSSIAKSTGLATILLSDSFIRLQPDVVLLLGDRYETHAAATTAMLMNIPIAHIHGGEITEGAVDEKIRHSITKMSSLHFTSTNVYRNRVIQMGESPEAVFAVGAPGIDNIVNMKLLSKSELESELGWKIKKPTALFTYHSETLSNDGAKGQILKILNIIRNIDINVLFTYANSDDGGRAINSEIVNFCSNNSIKYKVVKSLGQLKYLSSMKHVDLLIGNTSSGIIEAASFGRPVVNVGDRQKGRLKGVNVIDCNIGSLDSSIALAISDKFKKTINKNIINIYGSGSASDIILDKLVTQEFPMYKKFVDLYREVNE